MDDSPLFKAIAVLLAGASLVVLAWGIQVAFAQDVHVCKKDGKPITTDQTCWVVGAERAETRVPESFRPLGVGGGVAGGERPNAGPYHQGDEIPDR